MSRNQRLRPLQPIFDVRKRKGSIDVGNTPPGDPGVPPVACFTVDIVLGVVYFDADCSTDADGTIVDWAWDFGDGNTDSGSPTTSHVYTTTGIYDVTLVVTDNDGLDSAPLTESVGIGYDEILLAEVEAVFFVPQDEMTTYTWVDDLASIISGGLWAETVNGHGWVMAWWDETSPSISYLDVIANDLALIFMSDWFVSWWATGPTVPNYHDLVTIDMGGILLNPLDTFNTVNAAEGGDEIRWDPATGEVVHVFYNSGTFTPVVTLAIDYVVVGGGGAGGRVATVNIAAGGGGGGEVLTGSTSVSAPLTITIGAGGTSPAAGNNGGDGGDTSLDTIVTADGGGGGGHSGSSAGNAGGNGGGGGADAASAAGGTGDQFNGGTGRGSATASQRRGGGGGGASANGTGSSSPNPGGAGLTTWAGTHGGGGGGGSADAGTAGGGGGVGGGGTGGRHTTAGTAGAAGTGGGGGGGGSSGSGTGAGGAGGSGVVYIRYTI